MSAYPPRAWLLLALTVGLEIIATLSLKASHGFRDLVPSLAAISAYAGTVVVLALVLKTIPMSIAYVIWTGAGTLGIALLGTVLFSDRLSTSSWAGIVLVVVGVMMVNVGKKDPSAPGREQGGSSEGRNERSGATRADRTGRGRAHP
ncbi:multidrug efflux SMR transporter [Streptomyces sp. HB132]|uniref:DMT family transporter n=1 Tax=Streptomyces sp. HB132 TaxID=767388 RepID=UPI00195F3791|nr:multidrug efflux SMR transporter [Streptomyces sp. HB132]MBM7439354.1 multidrug transporter EmrE-like cation transporter [Streptomyces sp. HB132]